MWYPGYSDGDKVPDDDTTNCLRRITTADGTKVLPPAANLKIDAYTPR